jgi:hypothetical protein
MKPLRLVALALLVAVAVAAGCKKSNHNDVGVFVTPPAPAPVPPPPPTAAFVPAPVAAPPLAPPAEPEPVAVQGEVEVLTRGPVHEAFAEPVTFEAGTAIVILRAPPAPIAEMPPASRPAVAGITWIPGYWAWDEDRPDFLWVSGTWRVPPPSCSWVPGYWAAVADGFQWVPGFWTTTPGEVVYLPAPPAPVQVVPVGLAPSDAYVWVPGYWAWDGRRYVWQPGYWTVAQADWVWTPAYYAYTPRGCIFVEGHWDYRLAQRGFLFAPVYFGRGVYAQAAFSYSPTVVINVSVLTANFFARPGYGHYYFGDYFDDRYARAGIYPWYAFRERQGWYDPIFVHEEWRHRRDEPRWAERQRTDYEHRRAEPAARPPRTFAAEQIQLRAHPELAARHQEIAVPMSHVTPAETPYNRFEKLSDKQRREIEDKGKAVHEYRQQRSRWEAPPVQPPKEIKKPAVVRPPVEVKKPPETVRPPVEVKRPPETVRPPVEVKRPPETIRPPVEVKRPPETIRPPVEVKKPTETIRPREEVRTPAAPTTEMRKPEDRKEAAPQKVKIPRSPVEGVSAEIGKTPPRPERTRVDDDARGKAPPADPRGKGQPKGGPVEEEH